MAIDYNDFRNLQAKLAPKEPEVVIRTVESSAAWQLLVGWLDEQIKAAESKKASILERYTNDPVMSYEYMAKQKALLDIAHAEMIVYRQVAEKMNGYHPREP